MIGVLVSPVRAAAPGGVHADVVARGRPRPDPGVDRLPAVIGLGSAVLIVVAGVLLLAEAGGGLYWWPAAIVAGYLGAIVNAWVLLVEILR